MGKYKVLLVDDDPTILLVLSKVLIKEGYDVKIANSGVEAFELLKKKIFHLVITDLNMPDINGIEVLKKTKQLHPESVAMILTGFGDLETAIEAIRLDADDYLLKPCEPEEFFFRVESCLKKFEMKRKIKAYEGILTTCCVCNKFQDDTGKAPGTGPWLKIEQYIWKNTKLNLSSSYCPDCAHHAQKEAKALEKRTMFNLLNRHY